MSASVSRRPSAVFNRQLNNTNELRATPFKRDVSVDTADVKSTGEIDDAVDAKDGDDSSTPNKRKIACMACRNIKVTTIRKIPYLLTIPDVDCILYVTIATLSVRPFRCRSARSL
jgi:hypothetical protein